MNARLASLIDSETGRFEPYAWPGGYPIAYVTRDGGFLCAGCANDNLSLTRPTLCVCDHAKEAHLATFDGLPRECVACYAYTPQNCFTFETDEAFRCELFELSRDPAWEVVDYSIEEEPTDLCCDNCYQPLYGEDEDTSYGDTGIAEAY